jgi:hypothetical protein
LELPILAGAACSAPGGSGDFEITRFLIKQRANLFARDASGLTIFDHLNAALEKNPTSYQRDLWYCALQREGIDIGETIQAHPRVARYDKSYTPEHYRALCYLDRWTKEKLSEQTHDSLEACPWSEEEISELCRIHDKKQVEARRVEKRRQYLDNTDWRRRVKEMKAEMIGEKYSWQRSQ